MLVESEMKHWIAFPVPAPYLLLALFLSQVEGRLKGQRRPKQTVMEVTMYPKPSWE